MTNYLSVPRVDLESTRKDRAVALYAGLGRFIEETSPGIFSVPSQDGAGPMRSITVAMLLTRAVAALTTRSGGFPVSISWPWASITLPANVGVVPREATLSSAARAEAGYPCLRPWSSAPRRPRGRPSPRESSSAVPVAAPRGFSNQENRNARGCRASSGVAVPI